VEPLLYQRHRRHHGFRHYPIISPYHFTRPSPLRCLVHRCPTLRPCLSSTQPYQLPASPPCLGPPQHHRRPSLGCLILPLPSWRHHPSCTLPCYTVLLALPRLLQAHSFCLTAASSFAILCFSALLGCLFARKRDPSGLRHRNDISLMSPLLSSARCMQEHCALIREGDVTLVAVHLPRVAIACRTVACKLLLRSRKHAPHAATK
jgi:hypothetical protein